GATDAFSRALAPRFSEIWGQPVLVENRPGANQILGAEYVSRSAPDGATLLVSDASSFVINPHLYRKLPYNGVKSFTPITVLVRFPWVIAVHASVPANTFQEFVALAKAKPGSLSYGSFGLGSSAHISVDYLKNLLDRAFRERYVTKQWFEVVGNTPEEFAEYIKSEYARWDRLIKLSGVTVE